MISHDEILELWSEDAKIDKTELGDESLKIPQLHHKYWKILMSEKLQLHKYKMEMKKLRLDKHEHYSHGPSVETKEKGWVIPAKGLILKNELPLYLEADKELITLEAKISYTQEKIEALSDIIKSVNNRSYYIRDAISWENFKIGK